MIMKLVMVTMVVLGCAILNHLWGVKTKGSGLEAVDHIHYAPGLSTIYDRAEKRWFDPYDIGLKIAGLVSKIAFWCDRGVDWLYEGLTVKLTFALTRQIRRVHTGNYSVYIIWCILGIIGIGLFLICPIK